MWGTFLSEPLPIAGLVGRCPANFLIGREPVPVCRDFQLGRMPGQVLWGIRRRFHRLSPGQGLVAHVLRTRLPVAARRIATPALPLDLHVLSLPLAFILSQDQTLLGIFFIFQALTPTLSIPLKKSTLSNFYHSVLASCTTCLSIFSMNFLSPKAESFPLFSNGIAKIPLFSLLASPFRKIFEKSVQKTLK